MWPITAPIYGLSIRAYIPYCCSDVAHICPHIWPIYARIYAPLSGTKIRIIRKAIKKRKALYLIWTSLLALAIYKVAYRGKNRPCIRTCIPYYCPYIWPIYARMYAPLQPLYMAHVYAYIYPIAAPM